MNDELFGIGRTWLMCALVIVCSTVLMLRSSITVDVWQNMMQFALGVGGVKSTAGVVAGVFSKPKEVTKEGGQ